MCNSIETISCEWENDINGLPFTAIFGLILSFLCFFLWFCLQNIKNHKWMKRIYLLHLQICIEHPLESLFFSSHSQFKKKNNSTTAIQIISSAIFIYQKQQKKNPFKTTPRFWSLNENKKKCIIIANKLTDVFLNLVTTTIT